MKLKNKFLVYSIVVHLIFVVLLFLFLDTNQYAFVAVEILIVLCFFISLWLYNGIRKPHEIIAAGVESIKDQDFNSRLAKTGHHEMDELIEVYNQMIDQLREERIKHSEMNYFLEKLIAASPSGIIMFDQHGRISSANPAALRNPRLDNSMLNKTLDELQGKLAAELNLLKDGDSKIVTVNGLEVYKCQKAHFIDRGFSHFFIMIEELTDEIYKKEKSAYEKVIRMMSHETNNSIGAINSILSTVIGFKSQLDDSVREDYESALQVAITRNKSLSAIMSNFARVVKIPRPIKSETDVHALLASAKILMAASTEKDITWKWELEATNPVADIDAAQIEQVLINIIKNSIEAIPQKGTIIFRTSGAPLTLSIIDDGTGITEADSELLFSPFFSSKRNGQGVGLTLTREILINHGFPFSLASTNGCTEFKIVFQIPKSS